MGHTMFIKSSTCIDGGRLVFSFRALNRSLPLPMARRCCIAGKERVKEKEEEEKKKGGGGG